MRPDFDDLPLLLLERELRSEVLLLMLLDFGLYGLSGIRDCISKLSLLVDSWLCSVIVAS